MQKVTFIDDPYVIQYKTIQSCSIKMQ